MTTGTPIAVTPATKLQGLGWFGDGADGDVVISVNTVLAKHTYYRNLTVNTGVSLTMGTYQLWVSGILLNFGSINADGGAGGAASIGVAGTAGTAGGGVCSGSAGAVGKVGSLASSGGGGGGGGAVVIFAKIIINYGTISANGGNGGTSFASNGVGSGGGAGNNGAGAGNSIGGSGNNGGATTTPSAFAGGTAIQSNTTDGYSWRTPIRWASLVWVANPNQPYQGGSGGGSGAAATSVAGAGAAGGSGGGGGGVVLIVANFLVKGTITANGGLHSNAVVSGTGAASPGVDGIAGTVITIQN